MKEKHNMIVLSTGEILINFRKFQQIGEHLSEIQQYQNMPYDIVPNIDIQRELSKAKVSFESNVFTSKLACRPKE